MDKSVSNKKLPVPPKERKPDFYLVDRSRFIKCALTITKSRELAAALADAFDAPRMGVANAINAPVYRGVKINGNPIAFFLRYYILRVEAGILYQADLQRYNPMLFHALRNEFHKPDWKQSLQAAGQELKREGIIIEGLDKVEQMGDILLPRRGVGQSVLLVHRL